MAVLRMPANDYPHDFEVQNKKANKLPGKKFTPEAGITGRNRRISLILISFYYILFNHRNPFLKDQSC